MRRRLSGGHFYGDLVGRRSAGEILLSETRYAARAALPRHSHEQAYCCLVRRGGYTETYGRRSRSCGPMTLAFHPPAEVHSQRMLDAEVLSFNVEFPGGWRERVGDVARVLERPVHFSEGPLPALAMRLFQEFRDWDTFSPLVAEGLALELVAAAGRVAEKREGSVAPGWLGRVREVLDSQFAEALPLTELAELVGVHPVHLATTFRRHYRCTVGQYLRRVRVEHACRRLGASDADLAAIAVEVGFADQSHFTRVFKRVTGVTPGAYRRDAQR